jgi:V/A-type H+-transporting ATPase subunit D
MGLKLPRVELKLEKPAVPCGIGGTSASLDQAMMRFRETLPLLAELAELETAVIRLAHELRKTQRRCNALSKTFIPAHEQTVSYIAESLEERERESFTILKMIRNRLRGRAGGSDLGPPVTTR